MAKKKITITIEEDLYSKITKLAEKEKRSFSQQLCKLAEDKLDNMSNRKKSD